MAADCICTFVRLARYSFLNEIPFRVLTVDNEEIARGQLRGLFSLDPECELIGECSNAMEAIRSVDSTQPDILFVDVQMPEMDAFEVLRAIAERIAVRQNGRVLFITLAEIDWIEAADNCVCLHCGPETHLLRKTMSEVESRLSPARFVRIHRSAIVNVERIKELQPWFRGDYQVVLQDGTKLTLSRNHRRKLDA